MRSEVREREQNWNQKNREDKGEREQNWGERACSLFPLVSYNCFLLQIGWRHNHQNCFIGSWCWLVLFLKQCVLLHKKQGAGLGKGEGANSDILDSFKKSVLWKTDRNLGAHAPHHVLSSAPEVGRLTTYVELRTMIGQDERWRLWSSFPSKFLVPSPPMLRSTSRTKNIVASTPAISSSLLVVRKRETFHRPEIGYFSCANRISIKSLLSFQADSTVEHILISATDLRLESELDVWMAWN